ncbi:hypothetical protein PPROV_000729000 [Pycnococcus provasolii]|uniref:TPX2 C-terminal domain-containing protein n=1 Tax=Pycnococcus provasolii TaxID=41880 RepID=A0A830HP91_9CHLO|nr:hypothetical protein PPROV_000729000 [Pycnococcus provasolii]
MANNSGTASYTVCSTVALLLASTFVTAQRAPPRPGEEKELVWTCDAKYNGTSCLRDHLEDAQARTTSPNECDQPTIAHNARTARCTKAPTNERANAYRDNATSVRDIQQSAMPRASLPPRAPLAATGNAGTPPVNVPPLQLKGAENARYPYDNGAKLKAPAYLPPPVEKQPFRAPPLAVPKPAAASRTVDVPSARASIASSTRHGGARKPFFTAFRQCRPSDLHEMYVTPREETLPHIAERREQHLTELKEKFERRRALDDQRRAQERRRLRKEQQSLFAAQRERTLVKGKNVTGGLRGPFADEALKNSPRGRLPAPKPFEVTDRMKHERAMSEKSFVADYMRRRREREKEEEDDEVGYAMDELRRIDSMQMMGNMPRRRSSVSFQSRAVLAMLSLGKRGKS